MMTRQAPELAISAKKLGSRVNNGCSAAASGRVADLRSTRFVAERLFVVYVLKSADPVPRFYVGLTSDVK